MTCIRPFEATDILRFNNVNSDPWTATYNTGYYAYYLGTWPDFSVTAEGAFDTSIKAYMVGKHEPPSPDPNHHGHLTALSITPSYRGLGLARTLMNILENLSGPGIPSTLFDEDGREKAGGERDERDGVDAWFVDLFVRCNNGRATEMYERMGYSVFRRVVDYYHGMEGVGSTRDELDGFDMRKSLPKDTTGKYVRSNGRDILVSPDQVWS